VRPRRTPTTFRQHVGALRDLAWAWLVTGTISASVDDDVKPVANGTNDTIDGGVDTDTDTDTADAGLA
jgi:hypothetical protein